MMQMTREIAGASPLYRPSNFWNDLNKKNFEMLAELGVENFKRTVAQNYFNWLVVGIRDVQFRNALRSWMRRPSILPFLNRLEFPDTLRTTTGLEGRVGRWGFFLYKMFVGMLWEHAARLDRSGLSLTLEEPSLGRPIVILRKGRRISQDLANSLREYNSITADDIDLPANDRRVAELGAGYGRLAYIFLSDGASRYFIFDIPPALYVSQWYLTRLLPTKRIFRFRPIRDFSDVQRDVESSEIGFFTPNQMELFPDRCLGPGGTHNWLPSFLCGTFSPALACPRRDQCDLLPALLDSGLPVCSRRSAHHVPGPATPLTLLEVTGRPT